MKHTSLPRVKKEIFQILLYQFLIIAAVTCLFFICKGKQSTLSILAGAFSYWLPTSVFICAVSAQVSQWNGMHFMIAFIVGEAIKLLLCGILFVVFIKYLPIQLIDMLIGLVTAIAAFWLASIGLVCKKGPSHEF
jgi:F0F1-type ATP synthase assembly protein I